MNLSALSAKSGMLGVALFALAVALPAHASSSFVVRGIIDVTAPTKDAVYATGTYASNQDTTNNALGKNIAYKISKAKIQRYVNGKLTGANWKSIKFGQEVVMFGTGSDGTYTVNRLVINDRSFSIVGTVAGTTHDSDMFKVLVKTSSYKPITLKNTYVTVHYNSKTMCLQSNTEIGCSDIASDGQRIRVDGGVTGVNNTYNATKVWNKF